LDEGSLKSREEMYELYYYNQILSQIRELSADRIGLMVAKNLQGTITGLIKLSCGRQGEIIDVDDFIKQGEELKLNPEDIRETHPFQPKRSWALKLFHESDLYYKALGKEGGEPISKFNSMLPKIVPIMDDEETKQTSLAKEVPSLIVEEYVTEIFFHTLVALSDGKETSAELWTISNFIPQKIQVEVKAKWDELNAKIDSESEEYFDKVFDQLCSEASGKESKWKKRLIKNMIKVSKANRRVCEEELYKIIEIAEKIDAQKECSREFLKEFAYDPFAQEE